MAQRRAVNISIFENVQLNFTLKNFNDKCYCLLGGVLFEIVTIGIRHAHTMAAVAFSCRHRLRRQRWYTFGVNIFDKFFRSQFSSHSQCSFYFWMKFTNTNMNGWLRHLLKCHQHFNLWRLVEGKNLDIKTIIAAQKLSPSFSFVILCIQL